ncbi:MAG TPA: PilZ domain-containing protein [Pyrinomonadaceae bacterium]|jgi:hypothetical protein|nr:PilZ domain-containing protein [Pyrinomonadaceae bacterium]
MARARIDAASSPRATGQLLASQLMSERRNEKRLEVCLDAVWDGNSGNHPARITDLSEGGCYIDSLGESHVGEVLNLKLQLQNGDWLELSGAVAHQMPPMGFGVRFVNLTPEQLQNLRSLLEDLEGSGGTISAILSQ